MLNHYNVAGSAFSRIAHEARGRQPLQDWALMQQVLAAMIGRDQAQAHQTLEAIEKAGTENFAKEDAELAEFFDDTARTLLGPVTISPPAPGYQLAPFRIKQFALLPYALREIEELDVEDAAPLLDLFLKAQPSGKFAWIAELKPIAQKYLDDCRFYLAWKNNASPARTISPPDRRQLKTRSAISDAIFGKEKSAASSAAAAPSATPRQLSQKELAVAAQKKSQWLNDSKKKLIDDLNRKQFSGTFTDTTGTEYTGMSGADNQTIGLKLPYGIARVPWSKLAPKTLLAISSSFIQPSAPDAADRQWLCAVYANSTGQADAARKLAEAAAQSKPEYREQIDVLFSR